MNNYANRHWQLHGSVFDLSQSDENDDQNQSVKQLLMNPDADPNTPIETAIEFDTDNDKTHSNEIPINETRILEIINEGEGGSKNKSNEKESTAMVEGDGNDKSTNNAVH